MSAMMPLMRVLEQGGKFIQSIKHGVTMRGLSAGPPRKPLQPLNKDEKRQLEQVVRVMNHTINLITMLLFMKLAELRVTLIKADESCLQCCH